MARGLTNWLESYHQYLKEVETPEKFKIWSGISAISSTLKRKVWIDRVSFQLYPQQYIILVGPPGVGKGNAIRPMNQLIKKADTANVIADRVTAEKVVERMHTGFPVTTAVSGTSVKMAIERCATLVVPELPVYLNASTWTLEFMCEMWDRNEWEYDTKSKGTYKLQDLCVGLLGGCVPDFIRRLNSHDSTAAVSGGFTSRCVFVYETKKSKRIAFPTKNGSNSLEQQLVDDLQEISLLGGEFSFSKDARAFFENYYLQQVVNEFESDVVIGFKERMLAHIFKVAMCISASEGASLEISLPQLRKAIELIEEVRDNLDITFRAVGGSSLAVAQDKVMRFIEQRGVTTYKELLSSMHRDMMDDDLKKVLYVLCEIGFCVETDVSNRPVYTHNKNFNAKAVAQARGMSAGRP